MTQLGKLGKTKVRYSCDGKELNSFAEFLQKGNGKDKGCPTKNPQREAEGCHQGASTISEFAIALGASGNNEETASTFLLISIGGTYQLVEPRKFWSSEEIFSK